MTIETREARDIVSSLAIMDPASYGYSEIEAVCWACKGERDFRGESNHPVHGWNHTETCILKRAHELCFPEREEPTNG